MSEHSLLCVTVTAATTAELRQTARRGRRRRSHRAAARLGAAIPSVAGALAGRRRPVIVTCRAAWEGGGFTGRKKSGKRILAEALALGAEYVDVEWRAHFDDLRRATGGRRIVLSSHDFDGVPMRSRRARARRCDRPAPRS